MKKVMGMICMLFLLFCILPGCREKIPVGTGAVTIYFFYDTACGTCDGTEDFVRIVSEKIYQYKERFPYQLVMYNVFKNGERELAETVLKEYNIPVEDVSFPMVLIHGKVYEGMEEIEKNLKAEFLSGIGSSVLYFYREDCQECIDLKGFMDRIPEMVTVDGAEVPIHVTRLDSRKGKNGARIRELFKEYGVAEEDQMVPIIFMPSGYLAGGGEIEAHLFEYLERGDGLGKIRGE